MATALSKSGVPGRIELLLGKGHGWGNEDWNTTRQVGDEFFAQYFAEEIRVFAMLRACRSGSP